MLQLSLVAVICMEVCGLSQGILLELAASLLYSLCVAAFAMFLRRLLGSVKNLATVLPVLCVAMLLLCPVFVDLSMFYQVQFLFPPTYYIHAIHQPVWFFYMALYTALCGGAWWLLGKGKKHQ